ncbi:MAG TPA: pseudouridine synthase, partial [Polyangiaceae bacterium]
MERAAIWPEFRAEWVVHDDGEVIVVDKPVGVSSQAAEEGRPDDVVTRLSAWLGGAYLGVHQRLDRDTSGLLLFARKKENNAALAKQFEGRSVKKSYLAGVAGWPKGKDAVTLRDSIAPDRDGTMRVVKGRDARAKAAVTHVKVVGRKQDRALLELELETG